MPAKVTTIRIDPDVFRRLRGLARAEQRSVSAQISFLVLKELDQRPETGGTARIRGWLDHLDAPDGLDEFRQARVALSRSLRRRMR